MGDDNRHEMMESLFGAESGDSEEEPEPRPSDSNNSNSANSANSGRDDEEGEGEGGGDVEIESDLDGGGSERAGSEGGRDVESEGERGEASDREELSDREEEEPEASLSGSEASQPRGVAEDEENEVQQAREASEQGDYEQGDDEQGENEHERGDDELGDDEQGEEEQGEEEPGEDEQQASGGVAEVRDVFGDSDEEDEEVDRRRTKTRERSPLASPERLQSDDERSAQEGAAPDELLREDDEDQYESEEERQTERKREKPVGPPLDLEVPLKPPPGRADQLNLVRVSNIMGIECKPFDPKTYVEESTFVTDADGRKQRLRLEENVARWRIVQARDGSTTFESNARFVKWSDGSMQLLLGNEVLDLSVQDARHDQSHLFMRHPKSILQSQGRLLRKMKFMPSSLSSKSHKLLTALVDSRNKKVLKVKSVVTNIDPDKEKEGQEKAVEQRIRSKSDLQRKQDKISRKYSHTPSRDREAQLSPGYLEGALEEEEEADDYGRGSRRSMDHFQAQLDAERGAERRILSAKRQPAPVRRPQVKDRRPAPSRREMLEYGSEEEQREESEYESEPEEDEDLPMDEEVRDFDEEEEEEEEYEEEDRRRYADKGKLKSRGEEKRRVDRDEDDRKRSRNPSEEREGSPPRKSTQRRRVVVSESDDD